MPSRLLAVALMANVTCVSYAMKRTSTDRQSDDCNCCEAACRHLEGRLRPITTTRRSRAKVGNR